MTTADAHTLIGAYALDAVDPADQAAVEEHLAACPACAEELTQLRATGARLGAVVEATPPPALRAAVLAGVENVRQLPPRVAAGPPRAGRSRWTRPGLAAVALATAACCALGALGVVALDQHRQLGVVQRRAAALDALESAAAASARPLAGGGTLAVVTAGDRVLVSARGLPTLPGGRVYQLWLVGPAGPRSAGLVDGRARTADRLVTVTPATSARAVAVTAEPAGGSAAPTTAVLASAPLTG